MFSLCVFVFICHAVGWSVTPSTVSCFSFTAHLNVGNMLVAVRNIYDHHCILFSAHLLCVFRGIHLHKTKLIRAVNHIRWICDMRSMWRGCDNHAVMVHFKAFF